MIKLHSVLLKHSKKIPLHTNQRREGKREQMRRHRGAAKVEEVQHRAAQYQAAEDAKMVQFRALLASGPITIPKRQ